MKLCPDQRLHLALAVAERHIDYFCQRWDIRPSELIHEQFGIAVRPARSRQVAIAIYAAKWLELHTTAAGCA